MNHNRFHRINIFRDRLLGFSYNLRYISFPLAARVLFRWKQELTPLTAAPVFVSVQITDANEPCDSSPSKEERAP